MDKLERLLNLVSTLLNTTRALTAEELREQIGGYAPRDDTFRRQFERDKDDLREMGVPLVVEEVPGVDPPVLGYRIDRAAYYLDDPGLAPDELSALHLAASLVRLEGLDPTRSLWSLGGAVPAAAPLPPDRGELHPGTGPFVRPTIVLRAPEVLGDVYSALNERATIRFWHRGEQRSIDPHRLDHQRGHWYVIGFDHDRQAPRTFRLDRVTGPVEIGPPGSVTTVEEGRPGSRTPSWLMADGERRVARILVDESHVPIMSAACLDADVTITPTAAGQVVDLPFTNPDGVRALVLSLLDHAEVLEPADLRADVIAWLEAVP